MARISNAACRQLKEEALLDAQEERRQMAMLFPTSSALPISDDESFFARMETRHLVGIE